MRTLLDGHPLSDAGSTLGSALAAVRAKAGDRIVIDASADGHPVPAEHLDQPPPTQPYAGELAFRTADPVLVAIEALHDAQQALEELAPRHSRAAEMIQSGKTNLALDELGHVLTGWSTLHRTAELVTATASYGGDIAGQATLDAVGPATKELAERLAEIKKALGSQDWPGLSDTLAYDMDPLVQRWRGALTAMIEGVKAR